MDIGCRTDSSNVVLKKLEGDKMNEKEMSVFPAGGPNDALSLIHI